MFQDSSLHGLNVSVFCRSLICAFFFSLIFEACAPISGLSSFDLHLDGLLFVEYHGLSSQSEALSIPHPLPARYHADNNHRVGPAVLPSKHLCNEDVELKLSDTASPEFWCSPLFQCSRLAQCILDYFPLALVVYLFVVSQFLVLFLWFIAHRVQAGEEYCLSSISSFASVFPAINPDRVMECM